AAQQGVAPELPQRRRRRIRAERVQPAAVDAEACARGGGARRRARQRDGGAHEQPDGERRVPLPHARQDRRHGGAPRSLAVGEGAGGKRGGPDGTWSRGYDGFIWSKGMTTNV